MQMLSQRSHQGHGLVVAEKNFLRAIWRTKTLTIVDEVIRAVAEDNAGSGHHAA
jgi:hypothetical protein